LDYDEKSRVLKALAHPIRLRMVELLLDDECCVTDVQNALGLAQSTSSQHLLILKNAGVLHPKKYGTKTCYYVKDDRIVRLIQLLTENQ